MSRSLIFIPVLAVFLSCAAKERVEVFHMGEIEVRLYSTREAMTKELPEVLRLVDNLRVTDKVIKVLGYRSELQLRGSNAKPYSSRTT